MTVERKAFKALYNLISEGKTSEKEAFDIACGIFSINFQYVPTYITQEEQTPTLIEENQTSHRMTDWLEGKIIEKK